MIIVSATDDQYAQHLGVMLTSLLHHNREHTDLKLYVVDGDISESNKGKLQRAVEKYNRSIRFVKIRDPRYLSLKVHPKSDYISRETYARIFIPELLNNTIEKALYLDCDLIVLSDLGPLWKTKIKKNDYAAAVDISPIQSKSRRRKKADHLKLPINSPYFNAGVMLLNLQAWREHRLADQILSYIADHRGEMEYNDQDALNAMLRNRWLKLGPEWNYTSNHRSRMSLKHPAIVHFTGRRKPWNSDSPYRKLYAKYLKRSQWTKVI